MKTNEIIRGDIANRVYRRLGAVYEGVRYDMVRVAVGPWEGPNVLHPRREVTVQVVLPNRPSWQGKMIVALDDPGLYERVVERELANMLDQLAEYQPEDRSLSP